jgi:hypothetical protein
LMNAIGCVGRAQSTPGGLIGPVSPVELAADSCAVQALAGEFSPATPHSYLENARHYRAARMVGSLTQSLSAVATA